MDTENVSLLATPKAYEMIMDSLDNGKVQWAVKTAVSLALGRRERGKTDGFLLGGTYLSVWPRWAKSAEDESIIIISDNWLVGPGNRFDDVLPDCLPVDLA